MAFHETDAGQGLCQATKRSHTTRLESSAGMPTTKIPTRSLSAQPISLPGPRTSGDSIGRVYAACAATWHATGSINATGKVKTRA
jgi:hypothetical protein